MRRRRDRNQVLYQRDGREALEMRYFISSLALEVERFARAVCGHRTIENSCQWSLDFVYRADEWRIRDESVRDNMARLNRFTLSRLKQDLGEDGIIRNRRASGWCDAFLTGAG